MMTHFGGGASSRPNSPRKAQWQFAMVMSELLNFCNF